MPSRKLRTGPNPSPELKETIGALRNHWDEEPGVLEQGHRAMGGSGSNVKIRFRASRVTEYVRVHVQHDGGKGGRDYSSGTSASSQQVDCRKFGFQEVTVSRNGSDFYVVFLIPLVEMDGTKYRWDGNEGDDHMAAIGLGV